MAGAPCHFTLLYLHVCAWSSQRPEEVIGSPELELEALKTAVQVRIGDLR